MQTAADDDFATLLDVLAMSTETIFAINDRHRLVFWNPGMRKLLGHEAHEVIGKSCATVLAGDDAYGNRYCSESCAIMQIARSGEPVRQFQLTMKAKNGGAHCCDISIVKFVLPISRRFVLAHVVRPATAATVPAPPVVASTSVAPEQNDLTTRQSEILMLLATGLKPTEIAHRLCISPLTARNHLQTIYEKLEVHSQAEAVAFAYRTHLV
jgi:PAS domain S-box-containing protein